MTKEEKREYSKKWHQANREKRLEQKKKYRKINKEKILDYQREYYRANKEKYKKTQMGRASNLLSAYNQSDKKHNRGQGDLTARWIVENIFSQPCKHCGKEGWQLIGCNRLDNSKPHSKDNVEPCCKECNKKLKRKRAT